MSINDIANRYQKNGFIPFPLASFSKKPPKGSNLNTIDKYHHFEEKSNIGLYPGGTNGHVVIDADEQKSMRATERELLGLGLHESITIVQTPRRGLYHYWLRVLDVPPWVKAFYNLPEEIGRGEIRLHKKAYVLAPGSVLPEGSYRFVQGGIEEFVCQPIVKWSDLTWLLPKQSHYFQDIVEPLHLAVRLIYRPNPAVLMLFDQPEIKHTKFPGERISVPKINYDTGLPVIWEKNPETGEVTYNNYRTRSEAEQAIIFNLILAGWSFFEIQAKFDEEKPGHYAEYRDKERYLIVSYNNAISEMMRWDIRNELAFAYKYVNNSPWPGSVGDYNQKVLLAILAKAWQFRTFQPKVSLREIGEHAGINREDTISKVTKRLFSEGLINILFTDRFETNQYDLTNLIESVNKCNITHSPYPQGSNVSVIDTFSWQTADLWSRSMLGGSAKMVYTHLSDKPKKIVELMRLTGKCRNTVKTALRKLAPYKLAIEDERCWIRGDRSVESVAEELGSKQLAKRRQREHQRDREEFEEISRIRNYSNHG